MKGRVLPVLLILGIIIIASLSRIVGSSNSVVAQILDNYGYKFFYCPYNNYLYKGPNVPYQFRNYPTMRFPYPTRYPLPEQYPCPCNTPAVNLLLQDQDR
jgi:hypothetical protein